MASRQLPKVWNFIVCPTLACRLTDMIQATNIPLPVIIFNEGKVMDEALDCRWRCEQKEENVNVVCALWGLVANELIFYWLLLLLFY